MADEYAPLPRDYAPLWAATEKPKTETVVTPKAPFIPPASEAGYEKLPEGYTPRWGIEAKAPSIFRQAAEKVEKYIGQPSEPLPAEKYPQMSWGEFGSRALRSAPRSLANVAESTVEGLSPSNLPETLMNIGQMGYGAASKGLGAIGLGGPPEQRAKDEAVLDAMIKHYKESFGSKAQAEKYFAEDPFAAVADVGSAATLGAAPMTSLPGRAGTIARAVKTAGELASPETLPIKAAEAVAPTVPFFAKSILSGLSGLSKQTIEDFYKGGKDFDAGMIKKVISEDPDPQAAVNKLNNAMRAMRDERQTAYLSTKSGLQNQNVPLSFNDVDNAMNKVQNIAYSGPRKIEKNREARLAFDEIENKINEFKIPQSPLGGGNTMIDFDELKQAIDDIGSRYRDPKAKELVKEVRNSVKQTIVDLDPEYANLMDEYAGASQRIGEIERELGAPGAGKTLRKLVSAQKSYLKKPLIEEVEKKAPGLGKELAALEVAQSKVPIIPALLSGAWGNWAFPGLGAATGVLAEPRVAATATGALGAGSRLADTLTKAAIPTVAASRMVEPSFSGKKPIVVSRDLGGRIYRASGGRASITVDSLMRAVEDAKKHNQNQTKVILAEPDEHVVHALKIANDHI